MMIVSNSLSFFRGPLALLFLQSNPILRLFAIFMAMITDCVDGYLARKYKATSRFGAILDPVMDKLFVYFALWTFCSEGKIGTFEITAMLSRDFCLLIYGLFMVTKKVKEPIVFRAILWGKVITSLQFLTLMGLTFDFIFPWGFYTIFIILALFAFYELMQTASSSIAPTQINSKTQD